MARVLVIEDNPANLELMTYLLKAFGHQTLEARDGHAGLALAHSAQPDLILCDVQLPGLDGYALAPQLKADPELRRLPLVAVTAFAMVGDRDRVLAGGFDGYIPKPLVPETFVEQVEAFLRPDQRTSTARPAPAAERTSRPEPRATVLVVEPFPAQVEALRAVLEPDGYGVLAGYPVAAAVALAQRERPHLILSALHMPVDDAFVLLRALKADPLLRGVPVIVHAATATTLREEAALYAAGAVLVVSRPSEPHSLLQAVEACLRCA